MLTLSGAGGSDMLVISKQNKVGKLLFYVKGSIWLLLLLFAVN